MTDRPQRPGDDVTRKPPTRPHAPTPSSQNAKSAARPEPVIPAHRPQPRPVAPLTRPDAPPTAPPTAPTLDVPNVPLDPADPSAALANIVDDGDFILPAFDAPRDARDANARARPISPHHARLPFYATLGFRRTMIPILLTLGVSLPALAGWWLVLDEDSPLRATGKMFPITLLAVGAVMLLLAILNMSQVRRQLIASRPGAPAQV